MASHHYPNTTRDFRGRRWLSVFLRSAHLVAVIAFATVLLQTTTPLPEYAGSAVLITGVLIWLLDIWYKPGHLVEGAGLSMLLKLALIVWMIFAPDLRVPLFWIIVVWSGVFSHAPASFRNARLPGVELAGGKLSKKL
ncbi:MAG: hypothetical protein HZB47_09845 [Nitrosomonadales bacterium]|nr:hypothetical protein [Nitrosomonadales bacterium]